MNESKAVVNNNKEIDGKLAAEVLDRSVQDQNEVFDVMRRIIADERKNHIDKERVKIEDHSKDTSYAEETLKGIILAELK